MLLEKVQNRNPSAPQNIPTPLIEKWWRLQPCRPCDTAFTAPPEFVSFIIVATDVSTRSERHREKHPCLHFDRGRPEMAS